MAVTTAPSFSYELIAAEVEQKIQSGEYAPGSKLPTDSEQATTFGITPLTVRKAMKTLLKRGLILRQRGRGTFVAPGNSNQGFIAYVGDCEGHIYRDFLVKLQECTQQRGNKLSFFAIGEGDFAEMEEVRLKQLQAFLQGCGAAVVEVKHAPKYLAAIEKMVKRVVTLGPIWHVQQVARPLRISMDDGAAAEIALRHLMELKHRKIGFVTFGFAAEESPDAIDMEISWNTRLHKLRELVGNSCRNCELQTFAMVQIHPERTQQRLESFLASPNRPSAIICDGDFRAQAIYAVAAKLGLSVPKDLSVIGINDTPWSRELMPRLDSVNLGESEAASLAAWLCIDPNAPAKFACSIEPTLVRRESTAKYTE